MKHIRAMSAADCYTLSNGVPIPCIGFGTWQAKEGETAYNATLAALQAGYRHVDTAAGYGNEESVGRAVRSFCDLNGFVRKDLFITSKLHNNDHGYAAARAALHASLEKLGTEYLDLYLIHWPNPLKFRDSWQEANAGSWKAMEEAYADGKIRAIGVSNFLPHHIDALMQTASVVPMVNQIKLCPGQTQSTVTAFCSGMGMLLEAYSPMGTGSIFEYKPMAVLAEKYGKNPAQICIRWSLHNGFLPLPKSVTPARIISNLDVFDFELNEDDCALIAQMHDACAPARDPDTIVF